MKVSPNGEDEKPKTRFQSTKKLAKATQRQFRIEKKSSWQKKGKERKLARRTMEIRTWGKTGAGFLAKNSGSRKN